MSNEFGSGHIPPEEIEHVLRQLRHRVISMQTAQDANTELLHENTESLRVLTGRTYGYKDDPEGGAIGRLRHAQSIMTRQNWAILLLLLSTLGGVVATLLVHH